MSREAYSYCEALVRAGDRDRFVASLFAPAARRPHLHALYAFNLEIARIREAAHDVMAGEVRLQWWHDALHGIARGDMMANPVANALTDTLAQCHISAQPLIDLIEARRADLYDEPIADAGGLEDYARRTSSALMMMAARILGGGGGGDISAATESAGIAYAVTGLLSIVALHAARGQVFMPHAILDRHGVRSEDVLAGKSSPAWLASLREVRAQARRHYADFIGMAEALPQAAIPALLPVALVPALLARMERRGYDPLAVTELSALKRQWILWRAARAGFPPL